MTVDALDAQRLRRLLEVGQGLMSEPDPDAALHRILDVARDLTGAGYAALLILGPDGQQLEPRLASGITQASSSTGVTSTGHALPRESPRSFLGVSIVLRDEAYGTLYLSDRDDGPFEDRDEASAVILAQWAATVIANSRLYSHVARQGQELERAARGLEATTTIAAALGAETDIDRILELIVDRGRSLIDARAVIILLADGDELVVAASAGEGADTAIPTRVPISASAAGAVFRSGRSQRIADVQGRPQRTSGGFAQDAETALLVPLTYRGRHSGVLAAFDRLRDAREFDAEDERLLQAFASSAATAVATAQTVQADHLRHSIEAAEHERGRWARELHDETLQALAGLRVLLDTATKHPGGAAAAVAEASEQVGVEVEKLQALITELRPAALHDLGLAPALDTLVDRARTTQGFEIQTTIDLAFSAGRASTRLPLEVENTVYRVIQEALTNAGKHAAADRVTLEVRERGNEITIDVTDDGQGFDPRQADNGFGLIGMRERVTLLGGELHITSAPGRGASARAVIPTGRDAEKS